MWLCTPFGMFMPALRPPKTVPAGDDRLLQIRARRIVDLQRLKSEYLPELGEVIQLPHTDYEYRAYCTHEQWAAALAKMAMDIDYVKFKEQAEKKYGDHKLHSVYTAMWGTVFRLLSTKQHQSDYWGGFRPARRAAQPAAQEIPWSSLGIYESGTDAAEGDDESALLDAVPESWDDEVPVTRRPNGNIDHSFCDHRQTRGARRRCRTRNRNR